MTPPVNWPTLDEGADFLRVVLKPPRANRKDKKWGQTMDQIIVKAECHFGLRFAKWPHRWKVNAVRGWIDYERRRNTRSRRLGQDVLIFRIVDGEYRWTLANDAIEGSKFIVTFQLQGVVTALGVVIAMLTKCENIVKANGTQSMEARAIRRLRRHAAQLVDDATDMVEEAKAGLFE